jgi:hypothetical protein
VKPRNARELVEIAVPDVAPVGPERELGNDGESLFSHPSPSPVSSTASSVSSVALAMIDPWVADDAQHDAVEFYISTALCITESVAQKRVHGLHL